MPPEEVAPSPPPPSAPGRPLLRRGNGAWRKVVRWLKRIVTVLFALSVVAMIVVAWLPKPVPVEIATVVRGPLQVTVDEDGRARVKDRYVVSAPLGGSVARIELHPGDSIQQGDVVARMVPLSSPMLDERSQKTADARVAASDASRRQAKAQIERAKAAVEYSKREVERQRTLAKEGIIPQAELERAELEARTREAELTSAQFGSKVADYELTMAQAARGHLRGTGKDQEGMEVPSPITGRVLKVYQQSEGALQAGTPLVELGDPAALEIVVDVLTSDAVTINPGAPVNLERWGGDSLHAVVRLLEPSAFTRVSSLGVEEQRVNAIIDLRSPAEQWKPLGDGYRVEARIVVWQAEDVLKVPASSVFRSGEGWAVFAVRDGFARLQPVQVGRRSGLEVQIEEGLDEGDSVVTHPSDRVTDGVEVTTH